MKDIQWLVNRLKSMNTSEVIWRVQQKALQKTEYKKFFSVHLPIYEIPLSNELEGLEPNLDRLGINWDNNNYKFFQSLDIFGVFNYQVYKNQWNAGFQTESTWPTTDFSYDISTTQREDIGDIRTNWELNRHFQFVGLAKNYYITGEEKYLAELELLFNDWNAHNLFLHGVQWTSAMEVAIRLISWIYMYAFVKKRSNGKNIEFLSKVSHGIRVMADYILQHRARYSSANNHLIVEMLGIGVAGILFGYDKWINTSINVLTEELQKQNSLDGVNKEMSLHYQCFVMESYGIMWLLMNQNGLPIPKIWKIHLTCMSEFVADCCGDYGETVVFGDNDEGKILDFCGKIENYYHYVLQLMGLILDRKYTNLELIETVYWIAGKKAILDYCKKDSYKSELVRSYQEGGYTLLRSRDRKVLIGFDHAELGYGSIAAHGHADALSIQVFYEGKPVLVDPGTYNYHVPKEIRDDIRKTAAHNTVYIIGKEQAEMQGSFLWGKRYTVQGMMLKNSGESVSVNAKIQYSDVVHERTIEFDFERRIKILDKVTSSGEKAQIWHFSNDEEPRILSEQIKSKHTTIEQTGEGRGSFLYSNAYNHCVDGTWISIPFAGEKIETDIVLGENQ